MSLKSSFIFLITVLVSGCKTPETSVFLKRYDLKGPVKSLYISLFEATKMNDDIVLGESTHSYYYPYKTEKYVEFDINRNQTLLIEYNLFGNKTYESKLVWDNDGNLINTIDKRFKKGDTLSIDSTSFAYDSIGREIMISNFNKADRLYGQSKLIYKDKSRTKIEITNLGSYLVSKYDSLDRILTYTTYKVFSDTIRHDSFVYDDIVGEFMHEIIKDGTKTHFTYMYKYDESKRLVERQRLYKDSIYSSTFFNYSEDNQLKEEIAKRNDTIILHKKFDSNSNCIYDSCDVYFWTKVFDKKGNVLELMEYNSSLEPYSKNIYKYDKNGTLRNEVGLYFSDSLNRNQELNRYILEYDKYGNLIKEDWFYIDGRKETEKREYIFDKHKNWKRMIMYENDSITHIVDRKITYY